jgi:hypothetical protein
MHPPAWSRTPTRNCPASRTAATRRTPRREPALHRRPPVHFEDLVQGPRSLAELCAGCSSVCCLGRSWRPGRVRHLTASADGSRSHSIPVVASSLRNGLATTSCGGSENGSHRDGGRVGEAASCRRCPFVAIARRSSRRSDQSKPIESDTSIRCSCRTRTDPEYPSTMPTTTSYTSPVVVRGLTVQEFSAGWCSSALSDIASGSTP